MKNSWLIWLFVIVAVVTIFAVFNHQSVQKQKSLSEIFPSNEEVIPVDVEYEYVDTEPQQVTPQQQEEAAPVTTAAQPSPAPAQPSQQIETTSSEAMPTYTIQIGSFKKSEQAQDAVSKLQKAGHSSFVVSRDLGAKGIWYRVYAGKFNSRSEADAYLPSLKSIYKDAFVISPKK